MSRLHLKAHNSGSRSYTAYTQHKLTFTKPKSLFIVDTLGDREESVLLERLSDLPKPRVPRDVGIPRAGFTSSDVPVLCREPMLCLGVAILQALLESQVGSSTKRECYPYAMPKGRNTTVVRVDVSHSVLQVRPADSA